LESITATDYNRLKRVSQSSLKLSRLREIGSEFEEYSQHQTLRAQL
jgi:hypothetical protein